jgi:hypothetical protein
MSFRKLESISLVRDTLHYFLDAQDLNSLGATSKFQYQEVFGNRRRWTVLHGQKRLIALPQLVQNHRDHQNFRRGNSSFHLVETGFHALGLAQAYFVYEMAAHFLNLDYSNTTESEVISYSIPRLLHLGYTTVIMKILPIESVVVVNRKIFLTPSSKKADQTAVLVFCATYLAYGSYLAAGEYPRIGACIIAQSSFYTLMHAASAKKAIQVFGQVIRCVTSLRNPCTYIRNSLERTADRVGALLGDFFLPAPF